MREMHYFDMIEMHYFEERLLNGSFCLLASEFPRRTLLGSSMNRPGMVPEKLDRGTSGCMGVKWVRSVEMIVRPFQEFANKAGDVRIEDVPDARLVEPTDALIRVTRACICGSDLWPYNQLEHSETGVRMVVEAVGADVRTMKAGDLVVMPFAYSDGTCVFCHDGLHTSCIHGGFFGTGDVGGAQAEAVRVPQADGTLFVLPVGEDDALMPSLLTLSDVMGTGHHAAVAAKVGPGKS